MPLGFPSQDSQRSSSSSRKTSASASTISCTGYLPASSSAPATNKLSAKEQEILSRQRAISKIIHSKPTDTLPASKQKPASSLTPSPASTLASTATTHKSKFFTKNKAAPSILALQIQKQTQQKHKSKYAPGRPQKSIGGYLTSDESRKTTTLSSSSTQNLHDTTTATDTEVIDVWLPARTAPAILDLSNTPDSTDEFIPSDDDDDDDDDDDYGNDVKLSSLRRIHESKSDHSDIIILDDSDHDLTNKDNISTTTLGTTPHTVHQKPSTVKAPLPSSKQTLHRPKQKQQQNQQKQHLRPNRRGLTKNIMLSHTTTAATALAASKARLGLSGSATTTAKDKQTPGETDQNKGTGGLMASLLRKKSLSDGGTDATSRRRRKDRHAHDDDSDDDILDTGKPLEMEEYFHNLRHWNFWSEFDKMHARKPRPSRAEQKRRRERERGNRTGGDATTNGREAAAAKDETKQIPDTFRNRSQYQKIWAPLCLEEARAQILSDASMDWKHGGGGGNNGGKNRRGGDGGTHRNTLHVPVIATIHSNDLYNTAVDVMIVVCRPLDMEQNKRMNFGTNDVVVFAREESTFTKAFKGELMKKYNQRFDDLNVDDDDAVDAMKIVNQQEEAFGFVGHTEHPRRTVDGLRVHVSRRKWREVSKGEKEERLFLWKLGGNATATRQFTALCQVGSLPLLPNLLLGRGCKNNVIDEVTKTTAAADTSEISQKKEMLETMGGKSKVGKGFAAYAMKKFNASQFGAISAASAEYGKGGFTLVKGPPGTGKTTTLVALLNALHVRQFNQYFDKVRKIATEIGTTSTGAKKAALANAAKNKPRLLVCAPSNNAVDHILTKIMEDGFIDGNGTRYNPSVVRVGIGTGAGVKNMTLESKVNELLEEAKDMTKLDRAIAGYKTELSRIHADINKLRPRLHAITMASPWPLCKDWEIRTDALFEKTGKVYFVNHKEKTTTYECPPPPEPGETQFHANAMPEYRAFVSQLVKLIERYNKMTSKLELYSIAEKHGHNIISNAPGKFDSIRQQLETHILDTTHIVMTTLGTAGNQALKSTSKFEVVVVDEAAQSVEPATLAALQLGSSHAILVGDPQQLPATIFSLSGRNTKYDRSLFQRLEEAGHKVHLLDTQYRMIPAISNFPRRIFYGGYLKDGPNVKHAEYGNPLKKIVCSKFPAFHAFTVFDLDSREERGGTSLSNSTEAQFALHLYEGLASNTNYATTKSRIAIITPYSQQVGLLKRTFSKKLGPNYDKAVEVNTVDAFQGRESNIVIFSCVRAAGSGIGFLADVRRMNVALTRSKFFLFVIARCESIIVNPYWKQLVHHARDANSVIPVPVGGRYQDCFPNLRSLKAYNHQKEILPGSKRRRLSFADGNIEEDGEIL